MCLCIIQPLLHVLWRNVRLDLAVGHANSVNQNAAKVGDRDQPIWFYPLDWGRKAETRRWIASFYIQSFSSTPFRALSEIILASCLKRYMKRTLNLITYGIKSQASAPVWCASATHPPAQHTKECSVFEMRSKYQALGGSNLISSSPVDRWTNQSHSELR